MAINLAGLGVIYNNVSTLNQQQFQLLAVPGSLTLVAIDGVIQNPDTYTINKSLLTLDAPIAAGKWVYVVSGQGGTFVPQSYVDAADALKADQVTVDTQIAGKMDKSGGDFTGPVTVEEPTEPMNPVTLQLFESLPEIATPAYIDSVVGSKANAASTTAALNARIQASEKGSPNGVAELDEDGNIEVYQFPEVVFNDDKSFSKFGPLGVGPGQGRWYPRYPGIIKGIVGYVELPATGASIIVDINKNGVSQFPSGNRLIIPATQNFAEYTFTTFPTFTRGDYITVEIEQVGSTSTGSNLSLQIEYAYTP